MTNDPEATGEVLSMGHLEQLRKLRMDVALLAHVARTHRGRALPEDAPEGGLGDMAGSLAWLEACIRQVLKANGEGAAAGEAGAAAEDVEVAVMDADEPARDEAEHRYVSGVTLDQIDTIHRLIDRLRAYGDVVNGSNHALLSDATLGVIGDAVYRDAGALRELVDAIDAQRLALPFGTCPGVREEETSYLAQPAQPARPARKRSQVHSFRQLGVVALTGFCSLGARWPMGRAQPTKRWFSASTMARKLSRPSACCGFR